MGLIRRAENLHSSTEPRSVWQQRGQSVNRRFPGSARCCFRCFRAPLALTQTRPHTDTHKDTPTITETDSTRTQAGGDASTTHKERRTAAPPAGGGKQHHQQKEGGGTTTQKKLVIRAFLGALLWPLSFWSCLELCSILNKMS